MFFACTDKSTNPLLSQNQNNIQWPSLSDSPWPIFHGDPLSTGRSKYEGPLNGVIDWSFDASYLQTGISIGDDSTIYYYLGDLIGLGSTGDLRKKSNLNNNNFSWLTPIITRDNNIICAAGRFLYCLDIEMNIQWQLEYGSIIETMVTVDKDGNIYVIERNQVLHVLTPDGQEIWSISDSRFINYATGMSFSSDGKTLYIPGNGQVSLTAIDITERSILWEFGDKTLHNAPVISNEGVIYILPKPEDSDIFNSLYALNRDGTVKWEYTFRFHNHTLWYGNTPALDYSGNVYIATDSLISISKNGQLNWKRGLIGFSDCPLVTDINENIYVGTMSGREIFIFCFSKNGNEIWNLGLPEYQVGGSPAIDSMGRLIFPTWRSQRIYAIK
jgi:hypothetical protein